MAGFGFIRPFPSPGYEIWKDWRGYYLNVCEVFMWTEEEVKRYLPEKLCGWALDALNYLLHEFWTSDQKIRAWTLQETLYFFDTRLSNNPEFYENAFDRYLIEKEEYEKEALQCEVDSPVFQSDFVDREELPHQERIPESVKKKNVQVTANRAKSIMKGELTKGSSARRWSAVKTVGFGVKAVLEEKPDVRDGRQRSISKLNDNLSGAETVDVIDGSQVLIVTEKWKSRLRQSPSPKMNSSGK